MTGRAGEASRERPATLVIAVLTFGGVVASLAQTFIVPLLPTLGRHFHASTTEISWVVTANLLAATVCTPVLGRLGDMFGKRRLILTCQAILATGSVLCALSQSLPQLVTGRVLQGVAISMIPLGIGVIRDVVPAARVHHGIALISSTAGIGTAVGAPFGGLIVQRTSFHTIFWVAAGMSVLAFVGVVFAMRESPVRSPGRVDVAGAVVLAGFLVCLLLPVADGDRWGWGSTPTLVLFAAAGVLLACWLAVESRIRQPLINLRVTALRQVLLTNLTALLLGFLMFTNFLSTTQIVQMPTSTGYGFGLSLFGAGLCLVPGAVSIIVLAPTSAYISERFGARFTLVLGCAVIAAAYLLRALLTDVLWHVVLGSALVSGGIGLAYASLPAHIVAAVPQRMTSEANAVNTLVRMLGSAVSGAAVSAVLGAMTLPGSTLPRKQAFVAVFLVSGVTAVCAVVAARAIPTGRPARRPPVRPARPPGRITAAPAPPSPASCALASPPASRAASPAACPQISSMRSATDSTTRDGR